MAGGYGAYALAASAPAAGLSQQQLQQQVPWRPAVLWSWLAVWRRDPAHAFDFAFLFAYGGR